MRGGTLFFVIAVFVALPVYTQTNSITLSATPTVAIPVGPVINAPGGDLQMFGLGGGGSIRGDLVPGFAPLLFGRASLDFDFLPYNGADGGITVLSGGLAVGVTYSPAVRFTLRAAGGGGLYMAMSDLGTVRNPYFEGGAEVQVRVSPAFEIGLGAKYRHLTTPSGSLYQGIAVQLGFGYDLAGARKGTDLRIEPIIDPIFPLFYSYYDRNPAGHVTVTNNESTRFEQVKVSFYARQYMDGPRLCADLGTLRGGETRSIPVFALFNDSIFRVTEGTRTAGEIIIDYYYMGKERRISHPLTVEVQNRNAMTWDDDRKAAAFITAKDPLVLGFSRNVATTVRSEGPPPVSEDFRTALALFQALTIYGIGYAVDPQTPYAVLSGEETAIDFVQFPNQTLAYRGGDCDDISVLYAALLESVGIACALVTTPGHIYVAFDSGIAAESSGRFFGSSGDVIIREGKVWIPVEVTLVRDGFVRAWRIGAQQWREAEAAGTAEFYPVREAWKLYEPVGFVEGGIAVTLPPPERISEGYRREMSRFQESLVGARIAEIRTQDESGRRPAEFTANRIGVIYAQFGMLDRAAEQFRQALRRGTYAPALTNLGNVFYLQGDIQAAYEQYSRALAITPNSGSALAGAARTLHALEDYQKMNEAFAKLAEVNPQLAAGLNLPGMGSGTAAGRASEALSLEVSGWDE